MSDWRPSQPSNQVSTSTGFRVGPMTLADIVDNSFKLFKANWKELFKAILLFSIPSILFTLLVLIFNNGHTLSDSLSTAEPGQSSASFDFPTPWIIATIAFVAVNSIFITSMLTAVVSRLTAATYLGQPITAGTAIKGLGKFWGTTAAASLGYGLALVGAGVVASIPVGILAFISRYFLILLIFAFIPIVIVGVLLSLYLQIIAIEEANVSKAFNRSWSLVKRRFWPYLGTTLIITIVAGIVSTIVSTVFGLIGTLFSSIAEPLGYPFDAVNQFVGQLISVPIIAGALTLIYFDARVRSEGFDIELAAQRGEQQTPS